MAVVLVGAEAGRVLLGSNFHTVLPGRVYRGAQPSAADVDRLAKDYGVKTIVNLRGSGIPNGWYMDECPVCGLDNHPEDWESEDT